MEFESFKLGSVFYTRPNFPRKWCVVKILDQYNAIEAVDEEGIIGTMFAEDFPKCWQVNKDERA